MVKSRYFMLLSYAGSNYHGWQTQENTPDTVQQKLEESFSNLLQEPISITGCGRTDTGVHASYYVAHFDSESHVFKEDYDKWLFKLNKVLPGDIAVKKIIEVPGHFHSRFDATSRSYTYYIHQEKDPFREKFSYYHYGNLDLNLMNQGAAFLIGTHDFTSFSKTGSANKTCICDVYEARWDSHENGLVFTIRANRFLRNMVRSVVGALIKVGAEKIGPEEIKTILERKTRKQTTGTAPACGLFLSNVEYPYPIFNGK